MRKLGTVLDRLSGSAWVKRLLAVTAIFAALAVLVDFPGKLSKAWDGVFRNEILDIAHMQELSGLARLGDGSSGRSRLDRMHWPMAFSILNPTSDVITVEDISIRILTAMVDEGGKPRWIESASEIRRPIDIAGTIPALKALVAGQSDTDNTQKQALPVTLSGGEKIYVFDEVWFDLPPGFGFNDCASKSECNNLLIRSLGSQLVTGNWWRCPRGPFELSVQTRNHGTSLFTESPIILVEGCILITS